VQGSRALPFVVAGLSVVTGATVVVLLQHFTRATRSVAAPPGSNDAAPPKGELIALRTPEAYSTPLSSTRAVSESPQPVTSRPVAPVAITPATHAGVATSVPTVKPGSVARAIDITTSTGRNGTRLDTASIAREIARLRPTLEACYAAPECSQTHSPWCINSGYDKRVEWTLFVADDGHVDHSQHTGVGLQTINCGGHALGTLRLSPYAQGGNKSMDTLEVVITIQ
jgi:hypothetical protein